MEDININDANTKNVDIKFLEETNDNTDKRNNSNSNSDKKNDPLGKNSKKDTCSTYILKHTRKGQELKETSKGVNLPRAEKCLFMLNFELTEGGQISTTPKKKKLKRKKEKDEEDEEDEEEEDEEDDNNNINSIKQSNGPSLLISCHEIAAVYFDTIYEKIYTFEELCKENKDFKLFDSCIEAKASIDEILQKNKNNSQKFFIDFSDNTIKIHMKIIVFDKEKEIIFNVPKKELTTKQKADILPKLLKEVYEKMSYLQEENKKLKAENKRLKAGAGYGNFEDEFINSSEVYGRKVTEENEANEMKDNDTNNKEEGEPTPAPAANPKPKKKKREQRPQAFF